MYWIHTTIFARFAAHPLSKSRIPSATPWYVKTTAMAPAITFKTAYGCPLENHKSSHDHHGRIFSYAVVHFDGSSVQDRNCIGKRFMVHMQVPIRHSDVCMSRQTGDLFHRNTMPFQVTDICMLMLVSEEQPSNA